MDKKKRGIVKKAVKGCKKDGKGGPWDVAKGAATMALDPLGVRKVAPAVLSSVGALPSNLGKVVGSGVGFAKRIASDAAEGFKQGSAAGFNKKMPEATTATLDEAKVGYLKRKLDEAKSLPASATNLRTEEPLKVNGKTMPAKGMTTPPKGYVSPSDKKPKKKAPINPNFVPSNGIGVGP